MKVLHPRNLPTRIPWLSTAVLYLLLSKWNAPVWVWSMLSVPVAVIWGSCLYAISTQKQIDIFESASVGDSELYNTSPEAKNK